MSLDNDVGQVVAAQLPESGDEHVDLTALERRFTAAFPEQQDSVGHVGHGEATGQ